MIIIPELETVLLQPPRTGTSSVKDAVLNTYPKAFMLYRHMEANGIPVGYEKFHIVCQVRCPFERMESLFKYMSNPEFREDTNPTWFARVQAATAGGFEDWLLNSEYIFANPTPSLDKHFRPRYMVNHAWREQIKSQRLWAEGADQLIRYERLRGDVMATLNIDLDLHRGRSSQQSLEWTPAMIQHMRDWHDWDISLYFGRVPS
jgi:hypothetical protein